MSVARTAPWTILVVSLIAAVAAAGGAASPRAPGIGAWTDRLEALAPEDPMAYFELGEEVADAGTDAAQHDLARHLFSLAGLLDTERLGRSACLALADLEESPTAARRLRALAALLGSDSTAPVPAPDAVAGVGADAGPEAILALTEAFSAYRRGRGSRVTAALRVPGASELLQECDPFLPGGVNRFLEDSRRYRGNLRPSLSEDDVTTMLRLEVALLAGPERPWSSQLLVGRGRPLIEVDPDRLRETLRADPSRPLFRGGRWVQVGAP